MSELTKDDIKNGWTEETLRDYRQKQDAAAQDVIDWQLRPQPMPRQTTKYRPLKWRR